MPSVLAAGFTPPWWWDSLSNLIGVLVGAIIGAAIAYMIARQSSQEILKRDELTRNEQNKTAIFRMSVELVGILDVLGNMRQDLLGQLEMRNRPGFEDAEPWQFIKPTVGYTPYDVPNFNEAALAILFEGGHAALMQKMILLRRRCLSVHTSFAALNTRRETLNEHIPAPAQWDGNVGRSMLTAEEFRSLQRFTKPLNELIVSLSGHLDEDWTLAKEAASEFTLIAREILGKPNFEVTTVEELAAREGKVPSDQSNGSPQP